MSQHNSEPTYPLSPEDLSILSEGDARNLTPEEFEDLEEAEASIALVSYSTQDFDVDGLVRRLNNNDLVVPGFGTDDPEIQTANFQRGFVWTRKQMDRFIESLLLGYPIPGLFLVRQQSDKRYLVLDGQQRLLTLQAFYEGVHAGKVFALINVSKVYEGLTYKTLSESQKRVLDNSFLQSVVVSTDGSTDSQEAIYQIFERLNSGGTQLTPHEIRVALYSGKFITELEKLNNLPAWRSLYGKKNLRLRDQELILRILAFFIASAKYSKPLKSFLNRFAGENRSYDNAGLASAAHLFEEAAQLLEKAVGSSGLRRKGSLQINAASTEAVFFGLMQKLSENTPSPESVSSAFTSLMSTPEFVKATDTGTSAEPLVSTRLRLASEAFGSI